MPTISPLHRKGHRRATVAIRDGGGPGFVWDPTKPRLSMNRVYVYIGESLQTQTQSAVKDSRLNLDELQGLNEHPQRRVKKSHNGTRAENYNKSR